MSKLLLIDGSNYLFRAFHALPPLTTRAGEPTGAIKGFHSMLKSVYDTVKPDYVACVFDAHGKNFRHAIYSEYKSNRPPMPEELRVQIEPIHAMVKLLGWPLLEIEGVEADDVLASLATQAAAQGINVLIATGDKDLAQVVNERISIINTMTNVILDPVGVKDKYGVGPEKIIDYLSLMGDKVDNVPGINKCGPKTAVKWINEFGSLDGVVSHANEIKGKIGEYLREGIPFLDLARKLVTIDTQVDIVFSAENYVLKPMSESEMNAFYSRWEMKGVRRSNPIASYQKALKPKFVSATLGTTGDLFVAPDIPAENLQSEMRLEHRTEFTLVKDSIDILKMREELKKASEKGSPVAISVLSEHKNMMHDAIRMIAFSLSPLNIYVVPLEGDMAADKPFFFSALKPWFEADNKKVFYDSKLARHLFKNQGIHLAGRVDDVSLMSYVLEAHLKHELEFLASRTLNFSFVSESDFIGKRDIKSIATEELAQWLATKAALIKTLASVLIQRIKSDTGFSTIYYEEELPVSCILYEMERTGVALDSACLLRLTSELKNRVKASEVKILELAGEPFNPASPKQLGHILFEKLGLPVKKKTASGAPSTDEEVLQELALDYPLPKEILEYRKFVKLINTYTEKLPTMIDEDDGRIHTTFGQTTAVTGRLASSEPNLQNIPVRTQEGRRVREAFVAKVGHKIVSADYSQVELRIMAHISGDEGLLNAFANGQDIHRATAAEVFHKELSEVTAEERRMAKVINFGLIYGMSAFGLAKNLGIERRAAANYIEEYFVRYPKVADYMDKTRESAHRLGYVQTAFGRRLWLPDILSTRAQVRAAAERAAINAPMQGTAADLIKLAMVRVDRWLKEEKLQSRLVLQVHDELILEVPEAEVSLVQRKLPELMASVAQLNVKLLSEVGTGENWEAAH